MNIYDKDVLEHFLNLGTQPSGKYHAGISYTQ